MLKIQVSEWEKHKSCGLVIIDDCSDKFPASEILRPQKCLSLYRITTPIVWNQHGARNLGAFVSESPFLICTDMDHVLCTKDAEKISKEQPFLNEMWMFQRVTAPKMEYYKPHPNSFMCSRKKYWEVGGYDEDFAGTYGGDGIFIRQLSEITNRVMRHEISLIRYPREYVPDASTTEFDRKGQYKENYRKLFDKKRAENDLIPKNPIRFNWERQF